MGAGGFAVGFNGSLNDLQTLPLAAVAGSVTIVGENFSNLQGFDVTNIGGDLNIGAIRNGNEPPVDAGMDNLDALQIDNLTAIGGSVLISFNDQLNDVGFAALGSIGGKLEITNNSNLANIAGSGNLATAGALFFHDNPSVTVVNLPGLNTVVNEAVITRNPQMSTLTLTGLSSVGGNFELSFLANLADLNSLTQLNSVGSVAARFGDFLINDNTNLADITGLNGLQSVGGDLLLARDGSINELVLGSLGQIGGSFEVAQMDGLTDFTNNGGNNGLVLTSVGDALRIRENANLTSLKGLESVTSIGLTVSIDGNPKLDTVLIDGNNNGVADENGDAGLLAVTSVGNANPAVDGVQGDRGVIEAQNNPQLDENQLSDLIQDLNGFVGDQNCVVAGDPRCGLFFCGNQNTGAVNNLDPFFDAAACGAPAVVTPPPAGEGEGEGEGGQ